MSENGSTKVDAQHKGGNSSKGERILGNLPTVISEDQKVKVINWLIEENKEVFKKNRHVG